MASSARIATGPARSDYRRTVSAAAGVALLGCLCAVSFPAVGDPPEPEPALRQSNTSGADPVDVEEEHQLFPPPRLLLHFLIGPGLSHGLYWGLTAGSRIVAGLTAEAQFIFVLGHEDRFAGGVPGLRVGYRFSTGRLWLAPFVGFGHVAVHRFSTDVRTQVERDPISPLWGMRAGFVLGVFSLGLELFGCTTEIVEAYTDDQRPDGIGRERFESRITPWAMMLLLGLAI